MTPFKAGVLAITTIVLLAYFGFSKANPFANPYELKAMFRDVQNLKPRSPVRMAGVEVGKVTKVEPKDGGAAEVTMELRDDALPIRDDARAQIRSRIFLEGNFFVDIKPGSPSSGELDDGSARCERVLDVERDVLGDRAAPRVVEGRDLVVQRHRVDSSSTLSPVGFRARCGAGVR